MNIQLWLEKRIIFECLAGSHAYGMNTPDSDEDYRGVAIPPLAYKFGLKRFEQFESGKEDRTIFDINKFISLAVQNNPNILELLFISEDCIKKTTSFWDSLIKERTLFLSKRCRNTYTGYAFAQLKRIKTHRGWLLNPPAKEPLREDFGLPEQQKLANDQIGAIDSVLQTELGITREDIDRDNFTIEDITIFPEDIMKIYERERRYKNARRYWAQYNNWVKARNPQRAELEKKFGYDTKHASHIFRLLIQGEEILTEEKLSTRLSDDNRRLCMDVRRGAFTYEELIEHVERKISDFDRIYDSSTLRKSPDIEIIEKRLIEIVVSFYKKYGEI